MKIFNYEGFKKGDLLDDIKRPDGFGPTYHDKETNQWVHIGIGPLEMGYRTSCFQSNKDGDKEVKPEDFGVQAICYCTGKFEDKWEWEFMCTPEYFEKHKDYILKHTIRRVNNF